MVVPRGNPLFEKETLPYSDINILMNNLEQQGFTGFVRLDMGMEDYFFYSHGQFLRALEIENQVVRVFTRARILNRIKSEVPTSVYVLSSQLVNVLSLAFAFQPLYRNVDVKKKELKKIRDNMEADEHSGVLELTARDGTQFLVVDRGKIVFNNFARMYGQILCSPDDVTRFLENVGKYGAQLNVYAEKAPEIELRRRDIEEELERVKVLLAKTAGGFFQKDDVVSVDEYIVREWGIRGGTQFQVEMETPDGSLIVSKCATQKKLGGYVAIPAKLMKKLGLRDSDPLSVRPVK